MKIITLLLFIASCSLTNLKRSSLKNMSPENLIHSVRITGEGRGRIAFKGKKYSFQLDNFLNEKSDLIFSITIPFHGEEVMTFYDLKKAQLAKHEMLDYEKKFLSYFHEINLRQALDAKFLIKELRSIFRFVLASSLGKERTCENQKEVSSCAFDGEVFQLKIQNEELWITKIGDSSGRSSSIGVQLVAKNLTESFFQQTEIQVKRINLMDHPQRESFFSWEFFW